MTISLIVATAENNVIGKDNALPWHLPADLSYFKEKTMGHCVIMGRKNFDSIPEKYRPLNGRTNIVVTNQKEFHSEGATVVHSIEEGLELAKKKNETECFIIGGGEIFSQAIPLCDKIYLTRIHEHIEGTVFFPELKKEEWKEISRQDVPSDEKNKYDFSYIVLERTN